jgi:hypothetical protein
MEQNLPVASHLDIIQSNSTRED